MDDAKVTPCDVSCVLSQHAYVLFYIQKTDLEREIGSESLGEGAMPPEADPTDLGGFPGEPERDSSFTKFPEWEDPVEETLVPPITLDQWRVLQERNRPKAEFNVRGVELGLPPNAVIIHRSKYEMIKKNPEQNVDRISMSARAVAPQRAGDAGKVPHVAGRARATKRGKKRQSSREAVQGSLY